MTGAGETSVGRFEAGLRGGYRRVVRVAWVRRVLRALSFLVAPALLIVFAFGVLMLETLFAAPVVPIAVVAVAAPSLVLGWRGGAGQGAHVAAIVVPAVLVPIVGLLAVDVLWASAHAKQPDPVVGLLIASVAVSGIEYLYLRWLRRPAPRVPELWALLGVAGALALYVVTRRPLRLPEWQIWLAAGVMLVVIDLYLRVVTGPRIRYPFGWAVVLVVAFVFTVPLVGPASVELRAGVAQVAGFAALVAALAVNARAFTGQHPAVARIARHELVPVMGLAVVILAAGIALARSGTAADQPQGDPLPVATASTDPPPEALAHRPILLFDSDEILRTPVDVDMMFRSGLVELCPPGTAPLEPCPTLSGAGDLTDEGDLRFKTESFDNDSFDSRIYVDVVRHGGHEYLDYWWYLPDNPAKTARGAMCGAGLVIPEVTCFDHQSDWEGVTLVLDDATGTLQAVDYAAHKFVTQVRWSAARDAARGFAGRFKLTASEVESRPVVFIARGTHAAYPRPCDSDFCETGALSNDNAYNGRKAWPGNNHCDGCVALFPATKDGPASWNAFPGHWGTAFCAIRDFYCNRSDAPRSPWAQKGRFSHPWCITHREPDLRRRPAAVPAKERCTEQALRGAAA